MLQLEPVLPCLSCLTIAMVVVATTSLAVGIPATRLRITLPKSFYINTLDFVTWCDRFKEQAALERITRTQAPEVPLNEESFRFCIRYKFGRFFPGRVVQLLLFSKPVAQLFFGCASRKFRKDIDEIVSLADDIENEKAFQEKVYEFLKKSEVVHYLISL